MSEQVADHRPELRIDLDPPLVATRGREPVGLERPVSLLADGVAAQLTRDRRRRPAQPAGDLPDRQPGLAQVGDLDPFVLRQEPGTDLTNRQPLQRRHEPHDLAAAVGLVAARPVVPGRAGDTDFPSSGEDAPPSLAELHEPAALRRLRTPARPLLHTTRRRQHSLQNLGSVATAGRNHPSLLLFDRRAAQ
nr:hypothetical protein [Parafrankia sp. Ea1.12]